MVVVVVVYLLEQTNKHVKVWKVPYVNERMWMMSMDGIGWFVWLYSVYSLFLFMN